jgi:aerobic C4-dicarboxylate transport protein
MTATNSSSARPKGVQLLFRNLTFWVFIAIAAGVLLGHLRPAAGVRMEWISRKFIELIKLFIGPIIFLTIVTGISGMGDLKKVGRIGIKALLYFETVTTLALVIGVGIAWLLKPGHISRGSLSVQDPAKYTAGHGAFSWWRFFLSNFSLQILIVAIICGFILSYLPRKAQALEVLHRLSAWVFTGLKWVMYLAPLGAFAGIAFTVGKFGLHTLAPLARLIGSVYLAMILFVVLVLGSIMRYFRENIFTFLKSIREELLLVLGTSSSEAALPSIMRKLEVMGCSKPVVGLVVPTGYSFNLDGTSIYLSMAVLFIAQLYDVQLSFWELLSMIGILMVTSKGAAGVTGSGFIVLASTLTALHRIPVDGLAFLLGVDKFMSEARALTNIVGNGVATIVIAKSEKEFIKPEAAIALEEVG